ncbi:hypothetical protein J7E71_12530 [Mesobacillus foraminis]|uniref:hypothetical protein n=1 Tax=Mesobacillus foraminis TaxID=279826 RepID=UPI001BEB8EC0|nr:hypothetical protein [Mesobacillus foraminis]MBT2756781.1 hypothetical protein [Mesobacillus foraminis]
MADLIPIRNNQTVVYVVDRFIETGLESDQIVAITRTLSKSLGLSSEDEAEELVKNYLMSLGMVD